MVEEGYAYPNTLVVASDSHANMYGGVGCLGTPVVRTDAAAIWGTGNTWWQVPPVTRVTLHNTLPRGATGKDVIIALCSLFSKDEILNHALEFDASTETLANLSVDDRLSIANMTTEWGALSALFPVDRVTLDWLYNRAHTLKKRHGTHGHPRHSLKALKALETDSVNRADPGASYAAQLSLDLASVEPHIAGPNTVKQASSLSAISSKNIPIQKAYLVSCVNSRASDLKAAAEVVKGHSVAPGVEFYVAAASSEVQAESELTGDWATLLAAGAKPLPAGCGPCIGNPVKTLTCLLLITMF